MQQQQQHYVPVRPPEPRATGGPRRRLPSSVRDQLREPQEAEDRLETVRQYVVKVLAKLRPVAEKLAVFLAQPEADSEELRQVGFAAVLTSDTFRRAFGKHPHLVADTEGVLVVNIGAECRRASDIFYALDEFASVPPSIAVLLQPGGEPSEGYEVELRQTTDFFDVGADDVMSLFGEEVLSVRRVMTALERTRHLAAHAAVLIDERTEEIWRNQRTSCQHVLDRMLWELPGKCLDSIPAMPRREREGEVETNRFGDYIVTAELGAGSYGSVFKAEHPTHGTCAVKFMSKKDMRGIRSLISVDTEVCIMTNLARHPNVVYAHEALHTRGHILLSMNFVGELNLHSFVNKMLKESGAEALPPRQVEGLCRQAAAGVGHLHSCWVCHRDIKPKNFIVADDGRRLCLADFGFARRVCGDADRLQSWCGSLPFVAPEVLRLQKAPEGAEGYSGLAADVWSLAVNFLELGCGALAVERFLGWVPSRPKETDTQLHDLEQLPRAYSRSSMILVPSVHRAVVHMLLVRADDRCTMDWVLGGACLGAPSGSPSASERLAVPRWSSQP